MKKVYTLIITCGFTLFLSAQKLGGWNVSGSSNYGTSPLSPTSTNPDLTIGGLTRGSGVATTGSAASRGWGGTGWNNATASGNIAANKFITFSIAVNSGHSLTLNALNPFDYRRSGTGPTNVLLQYSINSGSYTDITTINLSSSSSSGSSAGPVDLSEIATLQNISAGTTVTMRIVPFGATSASGTFYIFDVANSTADDLAFTGTVIANSPLPVKFSSLDAKTINRSVFLKWNVGTEEGLNGYSVERSYDGRNYSNIGFVKASGEGSYSFVDASPSSITYYRIKSVDISGKYGYSTVAMVKAGKAMIILKAFPTPFINNVSIQHPTAVAGSMITISSADGRVIKSVVPAIGMQQTEVDLSSAKAGLYLVRYNSGNGESETLKIMKQ